MKQPETKTSWSSYLLIIPAIFILTISLRLFVFEVYSIPSQSMENTIVPGDKILVNKLSFGARLPSSPFEIPWVNVAFYLNDQAREWIDEKWWPYRRVKGLSDFKPGQIMVFNFRDDKVAYIKRCIAGPGDTLLLDKSFVFLNGRMQEYPGSLKYRYRLYTHDWENMKKLLDSMNIRHFKEKAGMTENEYGIFTDDLSCKKIKNAAFTDSVYRFFHTLKVNSLAFVKGGNLEWSIDCFGPYILPRKGMKIEMNYENYIKYRKIIKVYEGNDINYENDQVIINGKKQDSYIFKSSYYFMMGDNRHDSNDSRFKGPVPEEMIIGKAGLILFSNYEGSFKWDRVFRRI